MEYPCTNALASDGAANPITPLSFGFDFGISLFAKSDRAPVYDFCFVDDDAPLITAEEATARGYIFIGYVSASRGEVSVHTEEGCGAQMYLGVYALMGQLGERLKSHQNAKRAEMVERMTANGVTDADELIREVFPEL